MGRELDRFVQVDFHRFKAFQRFSLRLTPFNILVGPNNAGKSTILAAFRILGSGLRKAERSRAEFLKGPLGQTLGHKVDLASISVAEENLFYNYDDTDAAWVRFRLASGNSLLLFFPQQETCFLIPDAGGKPCERPTTFRANFNCRIGSVPILGPVEHRERLFGSEAARLALFNAGAARNFRNIWYHFPEHFEAFRQLLARTWNGMEINMPRHDLKNGQAFLQMWCVEDRRPREIVWAGFGFQVWCQMLTHLIQSQNVSIFLIDEPDIYLHSDLQRQLLGILRDLGPDVLIATHSMEIISEAEIDEIVVIDKTKGRGSRLKNSVDLGPLFKNLGSAMNPIMTQIAKTRRVIFVEGLDFPLISRFAKKLNFGRLANRSDFAVVPIEGFSPDRIRTYTKAMEATLGVKINAAAVLDRDFRCATEIAAIIHDCKPFAAVFIHECKEIENFLLVATAIDRATVVRLKDKARRGGPDLQFQPFAQAVLDEFAEDKRNYITGQFISAREAFDRASNSRIHKATLSTEVLDEIKRRWADPLKRLQMIPGKEALREINTRVSDAYKISLTSNAIVEAMTVAEVPYEMIELLAQLDVFVSAAVNVAVCASEAS